MARARGPAVWGFTSSRCWARHRIPAGTVVAESPREARELARRREPRAPRLYVWRERPLQPELPFGEDR